MATMHIISLRRALLLACTTLAALQNPCHAFSTCSSLLAHPSDVRISSRQHKIALSGRATHEEEDRSRPNIVVLKTHEDYVKFLEEDDRLCVVKFYANWCKSCQKFGVKYRHLAFEEGDRIIGMEGTTVHSGKVRFAEIEYAASAKLCKSLKVKKLPTVHMFRKGKGKIVDMTCKPSLFHLVADEMHRVLDDSGNIESLDDTELEAAETEQVEIHNNATSASFDRSMVAGSTLVDGIVASLGKEKEAPKKEKWFPFSF